MRKIFIAISVIASTLFAITPAHAITCPTATQAYSSTQCIQTLTTISNYSGVYSNQDCSSYNSLASGDNTQTPAVDSNNLCVGLDNLQVQKTVNNVYSCPNDLYGSGTLTATTCFYATVYSQTATYGSNGTKCAPSTTNGSYCYQEISDGVPTSSSGSYSCPSGFTLEGTSCWLGNYYSESATYTAGFSSCPSYSIGTDAGVCYHLGSYVLWQTTTYPVLRASYNASATVSTTMSCPSPNSSANLTSGNYYTSVSSSSAYCNWFIIFGAPVTTYNGYCPVNYTVNTTTGNCDAIPFIPNAVQGPVAQVFSCITYNYDGTTTTYISPTDDTMSEGDLSISCTGITPILTAVGTGTYLCMQSSATNGTKFLTSATDITGTTTTTTTTCTYSQDSVVIPDDTVQDWTNPNPDPVTCDTSEDWSLYVQCEANL